MYHEDTIILSSKISDSLKNVARGQEKKELRRHLQSSVIIPTQASSVIPTPLSIGDRDPCVDGISGRSSGNDTDSDAELSSRQSSALDRLRW
jgi:hypothetical protein